MGIEQQRALRSTIRWAQKECKKYIDESPYRGTGSKRIACEEFIAKMDRYSTKNRAMSMIFSVAKDVGLSVLDDLIMKGDAK